MPVYIIIQILFYAVLGVALQTLNVNKKNKLFAPSRLSYWVALFCAVGISIASARS